MNALRIWIGAMACLCILTPAHAGAARLTLPDGAVGVNALWEEGKAQYWYAEEQRFGADDVQSGIESNSPAEIAQGLLIFNWAFSQQSSDGSFPGTAGSPAGAYHTTAMFVEEAARATLLLKAYRPDLYGPVIAGYTSRLAQAVLWLMDPANASADTAIDSTYINNQYLMATTFGEVGLLTGDSTVTAASERLAKAGIAQQWAASWTTSDECVGLLYAGRYCLVSSDWDLNASLIETIDSGLAKEARYVGADGTISQAGCTGFGVDLPLDGTSTKTPDIPDIQAAFELGYQLTGDAEWQHYAEIVH